jgi:hypothetical protein
MMTEPAKAAGGKALPDWDAAANEAIKICGGDARQAVIALLVLNDALERELERTRVAVSNGYSRGWHRRRQDATDVETQG